MQKFSCFQQADHVHHCRRQLGVLVRYLQPQQAMGGVQQKAQELDQAAAAAFAPQGVQVDWPVAVASITIMLIFFITSTQRILGLDRFLLSWVRQRKSQKEEREQNELRNARARLERLMGDDGPP